MTVTTIISSISVIQLESESVAVVVDDHLRSSLRKTDAKRAQPDVAPERRRIVRSTFAPVEPFDDVSLYAPYTEVEDGSLTTEPAPLATGVIATTVVEAPPVRSTVVR